MRHRRKLKTIESRKRTNTKPTRRRYALCYHGAGILGSLTDLMCQQSSGNKKAEQDADKDTEAKLEEIKKIGGETGPKVVDDLIRAVFDVQLHVPDRVEQSVA